MKFRQNIKIENKVVGPGKPVFIIAEIGVNHNGSLRLAKEMIKAANGCGVDAVKFQTFKTEEFLANRDLQYSYVSEGKVIKESMFDMFKRLELPDQWHEELFNYARKERLIPLSSAADPQAVSLLKGLEVGAIKLASEDLTNVILVEAAAKSNLPLILSSGMADEEEIEKTLQVINRTGNNQIILLHCTSIYPTPPQEANIRRIKSLQERFLCPVGFSDHTEDNTAALGAVALGAIIIEKHFTLDKNMRGPDHRFSANPLELKSLVDSIRELEMSLGTGQIRPTKRELQSLKQFRRSITAAKDILKGTSITENSLCFKRPGTGLSPQELGLVLGKMAGRNIKAGEQIRLRDLLVKGQ